MFIGGIDTKKGIVAVLIAFFVACVMCFGTQTAFAEENGLGTVTDPQPPAEETFKKGECMDNAALVMFRTPKKMTKNKTRNQLKTTVSDIQISGLWQFKTSGALSSNSKGARKVTGTTSTAKYEGVALVKSKTLTTEQLVTKLSKRSDVMYAEPNYRVKALDFGREITNDTYSKFQWSMQDDAAAAAPNVPWQWEQNPGDPDSVVAILDTGVDYDHPDLAENMWENDHWPTLKGDHGYNFIKGNGDPMDDHGHGTHCAGIIGAVGDNNKGISGVNKHIKIMALKTLDEDGTAFLSHEIQAYNYIDIALDNEVPVKAINNSWGGGEYSVIFEELVDIVGEKGAITVCAAGNEALDNDEFPDFPSCYESPYIISVAATGKDGNLSEYSNYGENTVDVAAPGTNILSTVPYESYNPTLYGRDQNDYSKKYNDFGDGTNTWGFPASGEPTDPDNQGAIYLNGKIYDQAQAGGTEVDVRNETEGFENSGSMVIDVTNMKYHDLICVTVPYEIKSDANVGPVFSIMANSSAPDGAIGEDEGSLFAMVEAPRDIDLGSTDELDDRGLIGSYIDGKSSIWRHLEVECPENEDLDDIKGSDESKRQVIMVLYATKKGNYTIRIDDMGMSRQDKDIDFGQYDYQSGTSMAAPYITGAVALKAAELRDDADAESIINHTVSRAKATQLEPADKKIGQKGAFDFSKGPDKLPPRIGKIRVDQKNSKLLIYGSGIGKDDGPFKVEIGDHEGIFEEAVVEGYQEDGALIVDCKDKKWINNIKTVRVSRTDGTDPANSSTRRDVYLVKGKDKYELVRHITEIPSSPMTTDGKNIYWIDPEASGLFGMVLTDKESAAMQLCEIDEDDLFEQGKRNTAEYGMIFGDDLVYTGGAFYTVVEYGELQTPEGEDDGWVIFSDGSKQKKDTGFALFGDDEESPADTIYSGEMFLISVSENEEEEMEVRNLGALPKDDLAKIEDWTLATYNGKLYFMGGKSHIKGQKGLTNKVKIYDPATKKWSDGPDMKEARAGGKAIQSGGSLVYTLGYSNDMIGKDPAEQKYPANQIFDGKEWKVSKVAEEDAIEPHIISDMSLSEGHLESDASISLVQGGIVYTGLPAVNYGDTFIYDIKNDSFEDTGYNFIDKIEESEIDGIALGNALYGFDGSKGYRMPVKSGLITVKTNKLKGSGAISGGGSFLPGETANANIKASKMFRIKTIKVNGKKQSVGKNVQSKTVKFANLTENKNVEVEFEKYKAKVKVQKKGKGKVTGGKTYLIGKKAKIKVKAGKGQYIKSIKVDNKKIKVKKKATSKKFSFKVKKDCKVKVVFAKK